MVAKLFANCTLNLYTITLYLKCMIIFSFQSYRAIYKLF